MNGRAPAKRHRRTRSDGRRTRAAILGEAAQLATVEGIDGLSIARLAEAVGMSKSGLFAHFGSKEELQLATIEAASAVFEEQVLAPVAAGASPLEQLRQLAESYLHYVEGTFRGGCFFSSLVAEVDTRPGPVRDRALRFFAGWLERLEATVRDAQADGTIDAAEDPAQLAFELESSLFLANAMYVTVRTREPLDRARRAIARRLEAAAPRAAG